MISSLKRKRRNWVPFGLVWLLATWSGPFAMAEPPASQTDVKTWLRQLNAPELSQREQAEKELTALGPQVLDQLPVPGDRMPAEVRHRLTRIRQALEQADAQTALQPTHVTLAGQKLSLATVCAEFQKQTGNTLFDYRSAFGQQADELQVDLDLAHQPFWPAVDQLLDQAGLSVYHYSGEPRLALIVRTGQRRPRAESASYDGPFRIEATAVRGDRSLRNLEQQSLKVELEVAWEPRLQPIVIAQSLDQIQAIDDLGKPIGVAGAGETLRMPIQAGSTAVNMTIPLKLPARQVRQIAQLKGAIQAVAPGRVETFEFANLKQNKPQTLRRAGAIVRLDSVRKNNDLWELRLRLRYDDNAGALESHHGWVYQNVCYLVGPDGKRVEYAAQEKYREQPHELGIGYFFELPAGPGDYRLVYQTPAAISRTTVEFTLTEIPLP